jgi:hypothetical protein
MVGNRLGVRESNTRSCHRLTDGIDSERSRAHVDELSSNVVADDLRRHAGIADDLRRHAGITDSGL